METISKGDILIQIFIITVISPAFKKHTNCLKWGIPKKVSFFSKSFHKKPQNFNNKKNAKQTNDKKICFMIWEYSEHSLRPLEASRSVANASGERKKYDNRLFWYRLTLF